MRELVKIHSNNLVQISENAQSNSSNVFSAFLTNSLNCVVDLRPP